jgi:16S rRNA (guanine966-N2)-methyltransferase
VRIVGGQFRGRVLSSPEGSVTRPTADRVRESLFNILASAAIAEGRDELDGIAVLDVFAGTGALGFEALSRGAAHVSFVENAADALRVIGENIRKLGVADRTALLRFDATKPPKATKPHDLVLFDAPYRSGLALPSLLALDKMGWIAPNPTIVVEVASNEPLKAPDRFAITDERKYGAARLVFLMRAEKE